MSTNQQISTAIRALLSSKGLTVTGLAKELGMTRESVGRRLSGKQIWNVDELDVAARYMGFPDAFAINELARSFAEASERLAV